MEKRAKPTQFRLTQKNREKLEKAQELGFEMTEVVDTLIEKHFDSFLTEAVQKRIQQMQSALASR